MGEVGREKAITPLVTAATASSSSNSIQWLHASRVLRKCGFSWRQWALVLFTSACYALFVVQFSLPAITLESLVEEFPTFQSSCYIANVIFAVQSVSRLFSGCIGGLLADYYGRRHILMLSYLGCIGASVLGSVLTFHNVYLYLLWRSIITCFGSQSCILSGVYAIECIGTHYRAFVFFLAQLICVLYILIVTGYVSSQVQRPQGTARTTDIWQNVQRYGGLPFLLFSIIGFAVYVESPLWRLVKRWPRAKVWETFDDLNSSGITIRRLMRVDSLDQVRFKHIDDVDQLTLMHESKLCTCPPVDPFGWVPEAKTRRLSITETWHQAKLALQKYRHAERLSTTAEFVKSEKGSFCQEELSVVRVNPSALPFGPLHFSEQEQTGPMESSRPEDKSCPVESSYEASSQSCNTEASPSSLPVPDVMWDGSLRPSALCTSDMDKRIRVSWVSSRRTSEGQKRFADYHYKFLLPLFLLTRKPYWSLTFPLIVIWFLSAWSYWGLIAYYRQYFRLIGLDVSLVTMLSYAITIPFNVISYQIMKAPWGGRRITIRVLSLVGGLVSAILAFATGSGSSNGLGLSILAVLTMAVGSALWTPIISYSTERFPTEIRGTAVGLFSSMAGLSILMTSYVGNATFPANAAWLLPMFWAFTRFGVYVAAYQLDTDTQRRGGGQTTTSSTGGGANTLGGQSFPLASVPRLSPSVKLAINASKSQVCEGPTTTGPLTQLIVNEPIYVCRAPVKLKEPVANKHYQQPAVQEVLSQIKSINGGDWCIWELLNRKESIIHKFGKEVRNQILPYRVPELGIVTVSFIIGFISSILYWLNLDRRNLAIITIHDDSDTHQCMLYALSAVLKTRNTGTVPPNDYQEWLNDLTKELNNDLLYSGSLPPVRSPLASSLTIGMDPFIQKPSHLLPSSRRYLSYVHNMLQSSPGTSLFLKGREVKSKVYNLKCIMVENFFGPADSMVVEIYHVNNSPMENGAILNESLHKKSTGSRTARGDPIVSLRSPDVEEWEYTWWSHIREYQRRLKRTFHKSKDLSSTGNSKDALAIAYQTFLLARDTKRIRPLLSYNGEVLGSEINPPMKPDQSITLLPTSSSVYAECLSQRDTTQGSCCQWNFNGSVSLAGDVIIVIRQVCPSPELPLKRWANGDATLSTHPPPAAEGCLYSLTAVHHLNTAFVNNECIDLNIQDFNFYSPPAAEGRHPLSLIGLVNPNFRLHLLLSEAQKPLLDDEFLSPTNEDIEITSGPPPTEKPRGLVPSLDLNVLDVAGRNKKTFGKTLKETNRKLFKLSGGGDKTARRKQDTGIDSGFIDLAEWQRDCLLRHPTTTLSIEMRGSMLEFIARHCVQPDSKNFEWINDTGCTLQELVLCIKCCDNSLGAIELADRYFGRESSFVEVKKDRRPGNSGKLIKGFFNKITLGALDFFHSDVTPREHRRTGSFDQSQIPTQTDTQSKEAASPPAQMPSMAAAKHAFFQSPDRGTAQPIPATARQSADEKPEPVIARRRNSVQQIAIEAYDDVTAEETPACRKPTKVLPRNPYEPPKMHIARPDASTEASSDGQRTGETVPTTEDGASGSPLPTEPTSTRPSLPAGLLAAITGNKPEPKQSKPEESPLKDSVSKTVDTRGLTRASAPTSTTEAIEVKPNAPQGGGFRLSDALKEGITGGKTTLKKKNQPRPIMRKAETTTTSTPQQKNEPENQGGLSALFARKANDIKAAAEPTKKAPLGRKLFWKPLEAVNLNETIFGELDDHNGIMFSMDKEILSKVFSKDVKKAIPKKNPPVNAHASNQQSEEDSNKKVAIIDDRRAQNVGIVVLRLKTPPPELAKQLMSLEFATNCAGEMLEKLESIFFTEEEEELLEKHFKTGTEADLRDVPERRLLPLRKAVLPRGRARTRILGAYLKWPKWVEELESSLSIIRQASGEMRSCLCFRAMLSAVLRWGNFVNYGSNELHIKAITLGSLLKLTEFKTTVDAKITSLHYIVAALLTSTDRVEDALAFARMTSEMSSVRNAAKVTSEGLELVWKQLQSSKELVKTEITIYLADYEDKTVADVTIDCGIRKLREIYERMCSDSTRLDQISKDTMGLVQSTAKFFGDEEVQAPATRQFHIGSVFSTLDEFLRKFDECVKDIVRRTALYASILSEEQTPQLIKFVTAFTGKPLSKSAMMAIEANQDFNRIERAKCSQTDTVTT